MGDAHLVGGVAGLNLVFLATGFCLLSPALHGLGLRARLSYAGLALMVGAGLMGVVLSIAAVAGATAGPLALAIASPLLAALGLLAGRVAPKRSRRAEVGRGASALEDAIATVACCGVIAIASFALIGAFRSSPWLDDTWTFWVPKGLVVSDHGLVAQLWTGSGGHSAFTSPDYPLWWSIVTAMDLHFVGGIDLHAINAQLTLLVIAFVAALARLLWGVVRPAILWPALLLLSACPELFRQAQGGGADLPIALYLALFSLTAVAWLTRRDGFALAGAFVFGATVLAVKSEGAPQLVLLVVLLTVLGVRSGFKALVPLWGATAGAFALAAPWLEWRRVHHIHGDFTLSQALSPSYLFSRTDRVVPTLQALRTHLLGPREWLVVVPLLIAVSLLAAVRSRRWLWLAPTILVAGDFLFWVWANWADPQSLSYRLLTSSYRVVDSTVLLAASFLPLLAERLFRAEQAREG